MEYMAGQILSNSVGRIDVEQDKKRMFLILDVDYEESKPKNYTVRSLIPNSGLMTMKADVFEALVGYHKFQVITLSKNKEPKKPAKSVGATETVKYSIGQKLTLNVKLQSTEKYDNKIFIGYLFGKGSIKEIAYVNKLQNDSLYLVDWTFDHKDYSHSEYYYGADLQKLISNGTIVLEGESNK
jgi:hypothetical protein